MIILSFITILVFGVLWSGFEPELQDVPRFLAQVFAGSKKVLRVLSP